jgi:hypothetical protein
MFRNQHDGGPVKTTWRDRITRIKNNLDLIGAYLGLIAIVIFLLIKD